MEVDIRRFLGARWVQLHHLALVNLNVLSYLQVVVRQAVDVASVACVQRTARTLHDVGF